jgi:Zn-dependent protease with chaperone function
MGLVLVTGMMIVLPLVYLALIAAAGYGVFWYATHFAFLLRASRGGLHFYLLKLAIYCAPVLSGVVLVLFMTKPLFARRARHAQPLAMNPALEPALFAFIAKICDLVGAPMPRRIDLLCELNAAASFRRGAASFFGDDLVLTIGLPLVAGLTLQEFAGIVAHEFGHFTQGFGMRLSYVVRRINGWFARLVFQRDAMDMALEEWGTEAQDLWSLIVINCIRLAVGFSRILLWMLMMLGHAVSCFFLRQMEYDADSYEIKIAGSAASESALRRMAELNEALGRGYKEIRTTWNLSRRLPDDLPAYMVLQHSKTNKAIWERIQDRLGLATTGLFDTHPSDGDRIRRARQAGEPGVFHLDQPASVLFSRFDIVSKQVTHLHYTEDLGLSIDAANLRPVESRTTE